MTIWAAVAITACGERGDQAPAFDAATVAEQDRYGGTVVVPLGFDPPTMLGLMAMDFESMWIHQGMLSMPLVRYDQELRPQPWLAERWDTVRVAPDTIALTLHLRRDVRWHDGVPTTAEDVRFTYERMHDPRTGFLRRAFLSEWSPRMEVIDSFTVRFRLRPHAEFLDFWTWDVILPAHVLADVPPAELRNHPFTQRPLGNGPFRFARRTPGQDLVLEANPYFPAALGGRPYIDRVVFRVITDPTSGLTELLTGGIHLRLLPPEHVERVRGTPGFAIADYSTWGWTQLVWNTRRPPFDDPRVRRALSVGIDRQALVDGVLLGLGDVGRWTVTPSHWQFDPTDEATHVPHDPAEAIRLLADSGWRDRDGDGVAEDAGGRPLRFTLLSFRESASHAQALTIIQAQLRRIGADVRIRLMEEGTLLHLVEGRLNESGERVRDFDGFLTNWETGPRSHDAWFLHSRHRDENLAVASYGNLSADSLMDALAAVLDRDASRPLWREYQRLMVQESPVAVLYYARQAAGVSDRLQGVELDSRGPFVSARSWWLTPNGRGR